MFKRKRDTAATPEHVQKPVNDNFDTSIDASDINPLEKKKRSREDKRQFLVAYVFALLFIALALVLLSYFNQVRATREQIQNLTEEHNLFSVSALGSIDKLTTQLDTLREERDSLSEANTALENKLSDMQSEQNSLEAKLEVAAAEQEALEDKNAALELTVNAVTNAENAISLFNNGDYDGAAAAVSELREGDGEEELSKFPSLNKSYQNVCTKLENRGYLE